MSIARRAFAVAFLLSAPSLALAVDWDEGLDGDLSSDQFAPTDFGILAEGAHTVSGATEADTPDRDFWTFDIAPGTELASIVLNSYSGPAGGGSFFAIEDGVGFSTLTDASGYLGTTLVGNIAGAQAGDDVLDDLGGALFGGAGFTGALGPGSYTLWFQETGDVTEYSFTLNVTPAPGAVALLGFAGLGAMRRRRA